MHEKLADGRPPLSMAGRRTGTNVKTSYLFPIGESAKLSSRVFALCRALRGDRRRETTPAANGRKVLVCFQIAIAASTSISLQVEPIARDSTVHVRQPL